MNDLLDIATGAARAAGDLLLDRFGGPGTGIGTKSSPTDMVSDADRAAEDAIVAVIKGARPDDGIVGEEAGTSEGNSNVVWVIDPLDGTTNYLYGIPQWAISIAAQVVDTTISGVVYDPVRDELFAATKGERATLNGKPIGVSRQQDLTQALIATGFSYDPDERRTAAGMLEHIIPRVRDVRRAGAAALDLAWVACGRLDGYYEAPSHLWDWAAGDLIVREAGGVTMPLEAIGPGGPGLIAANAGLFQPLRALVIESHPTQSGP